MAGRQPKGRRRFLGRRRGRSAGPPPAGWGGAGPGGGWPPGLVAGGRASREGGPPARGCSGGTAFPSTRLFLSGNAVLLPSNADDAI